MFFDLLSQGNQSLVYFLDVSRGELDQLVQVADFEESVGVNTQEFSESCAVCFDADALQPLESVISLIEKRIECWNSCRRCVLPQRVLRLIVIWIRQLKLVVLEKLLTTLLMEGDSLSDISESALQQKSAT